ncbi:MAG: transglycosylase SLT domain-containing protein [Pseudomonadota bacterium]
MDWKTALQSLRQYKLPRTRALEQEIERLRAEHASVNATLERVRDELTRAHAADLQQITLLQTQLGDIEYDRNAARAQALTLEQSLEEVRSEFERTHNSDNKQIAALQSQLVQIETDRDSARAQSTELEQALDELRTEFARTHSADSAQITTLQSQLTRIESDRDNAQAQAQGLEQSLAELRAEFARSHNADTEQINALQARLVQLEADRNSARQQAQLLDAELRQSREREQTTEQRLQLLESQLERTHDRHESELSVARAAFASLQSEQQSLLSMQSEMTRNFSDASQVLVKSVQTVARPSLWQMVLLACLLFLSGALATALVLRESREPQLDLARVSASIDGLQSMMQTHFRTHEELLTTLTRLVDGLTVEEPAPQAAPVPEPEESDDHVQLDVMPGTQVRQVQANLQVLGFDIGPAGVDGVRGARTGQALSWYRTLYLPESAEASMQEIEASLQYHADVARADAEKYGIDSAVTAAIRLGSLRTGVEFPYLMELAAVESSFNPRAQAPTTSAAGLYQFKEETWLEAIKQHGDSYGLGRYARLVEYSVDESGKRQPQVSDPTLRQQVLDLRFNPGLSALMTAEKVRDGMRKLSGKLEREPRRADLYLTHFFGMSGALSFLDALSTNPDGIAGEIFPGPARRNRGIFQRSNRSLRTVAEVYRLLERKFNTSRYEGG